jgi:hypothetical protein
MKQLIVYVQDADAMQQQACSEKKCITCFENKGCMYEPYLIAAINNSETPYLAQQQSADLHSLIKQQQA